MFKTPNSSTDINAPRSVYQIDCKHGKKYVGETSDFEVRMEQHFTGQGAKVTKKFEPIRAKELDTVPGYFAKEVEQEYTEELIDRYGYENVRGGLYTNSKTLRKTRKTSCCERCGRDSHTASSCYATYDVKGECIHEDQPRLTIYISYPLLSFSLIPRTESRL